MSARDTEKANAAIARAVIGLKLERTDPIAIAAALYGQIEGLADELDDTRRQIIRETLSAALARPDIPCSVANDPAPARAVL